MTQWAQSFGQFLFGSQTMQESVSENVTSASVDPWRIAVCPVAYPGWGVRGTIRVLKPVCLGSRPVICID
jgi:hypothetical protein